MFRSSGNRIYRAVRQVYTRSHVLKTLDASRALPILDPSCDPLHIIRGFQSVSRRSLPSLFISNSTRPPHMGVTTSQVHTIHTLAESSLRGELVLPGEEMIESLPEVRAADAAILNGKFAIAKQELSRAKEIASMIPSPAFKLSVVLRLAKLAQILGNHLDEITAYETALKILAEHMPLEECANPVKDGEGKDNQDERGNGDRADLPSLSAVFRHTPKPVSVPVDSNTPQPGTGESGPVVKVTPSSSARIGYAADSPALTQWNSILCSRFIAMLQLGYIDQVISEIEDRIPQMATLSNFHGLLCLHNLRGVALLLRSAPEPLKEAASPPLVTKRAGNAGEGGQGKDSPIPPTTDVIGLISAIPQGTEANPSSLATSLFADVPSVSLDLLPPDILSAIEAHLSALDIAVRGIDDLISVSDTLLHLHTCLTALLPTHPTLTPLASHILNQALSICEKVAPVPEVPRVDKLKRDSAQKSQQQQQQQQHHQQEDSTSSSPSSPSSSIPSSSTTPSVMSHTPVHVTWYGPRLPIVNVLLQMPQPSARTRALKAVERHLPGDPHALSRSLIALAESMVQVDPIASEGLFRSAIGYLEKVPQTATTLLTWQDGCSGYAHLLSKMTWNGAKREPEAIKMLEKIERVLGDRQSLKKMQKRKYQVNLNLDETMRGNEKKNTTEDNSTGTSSSPVSTTTSTSTSTSTTSSSSSSSSTSSSPPKQSWRQTVQPDRPSSSSTSESKSPNEPSSSDKEARVKEPRSMLEWWQPNIRPLEYWVIERYSR